MKEIRELGSWLLYLLAMEFFVAGLSSNPLISLAALPVIILGGHMVIVAFSDHTWYPEKELYSAFTTQKERSLFLVMFTLAGIMASLLLGAIPFAVIRWASLSEIFLACVPFAFGATPIMFLTQRAILWALEHNGESLSLAATPRSFAEFLVRDFKDVLWELGIISEVPSA
jgi:hypothetical protein